MRFLLILVLFISFTSCGNHIPQVQSDYAIIYEKQDSLLILEKRDEFKKVSLYRMSFLLEEIALSFLGSPYKAHTLEVGDEESLVINLREFDCTTFVETCLALATTLKMGGHTFDSYQHILKRIRYRNGFLDGYNSRLHYFTDWITDNSEIGLIKDVTKILDGIPYPNTVNFMSNHVTAYRQLANDTSLVAGIRGIEQSISKRDYYYIPKEELHKIEIYLEEGMIVAFTTNIKGLDVVHTGITVRRGEKIKLLHASSDAGEVVVTENTLIEYIMENKLQTGAFLLKVD